MNESALLKTEYKEVPLFGRGKVRDVYDLGDRLLIVSTDRISAFDYVLPVGIPGKGRVLNRLSAFWFGLTAKITDNHLLSVDDKDLPRELKAHAADLSGRFMLVRKAEVFPVECVVRGYLSGSAWKEYQNSGSICGIRLPKGLRESDRLPEPVFTPTTKASIGHDEPITFKQVKETVGSKAAEKMRKKSLEVYGLAAGFAESKGIIIADTKFEWGALNGGIMLCDEALTPDSSRFWDKEAYKPGGSQESFDKQYVRDYLESIKWNKQPPVPGLPDEVVARTSEKYRKALELLTG